MGFLRDLGDAVTFNAFDFNNRGSGLKNWGGDLGYSITGGIADFRGPRKRSVWERIGSDNFGGKPELPEFESMLNEDGMIDEKYRLQNQVNTGALEALREEALRDPQSQSLWGKMMLEDLSNQEMTAQSDMMRQGENIRANQLAQMAARGGAQTGSAERMGRMSMRDMLRAKQANRREFDKREMGIKIQDEQNRLNTLQNQTGNELGMGQYLTSLDRGNNQASLSEIGAKRNYDMDRFRTEADIWGSERNSKAQKEAAKKSGGGGCFITTAFVEKMGLNDDHDILNTMRSLRDNYLAFLKGGEEEIKKYYEIAPKILEKLPSNHEDWDMIKQSVLQSYAYAKNDEKEKAHKAYKEMVNTLERNWL